MTQTMTQPTKQIWSPRVKQPRVGDWVWFYDRGEGAEISALVTGNRKGILDLTVWRKNALMPTIHSGVRHRDDPCHVERPERARDTGTWTFKGDKIRPFINPTKPDDEPDTKVGSRAFKDSRDNNKKD